MNQTFDTKKIKSLVNIWDLVPDRAKLHRESATELSGPCPMCGGTDRFHCTADWWFCRQCHEKRGDVFDFVQFLGLASDFRSACDYLARETGVTPIATPLRTAGVPEKVKAARTTGSASWDTPAWQQEARQLLDTATRRLDLPEGEAGRSYLAGRGILPATWEAWGLGYGDVWHPRRNKRLPAIILPWRRGETIKALQFRFIGEDITHSERFAQKAGGDRTLFGVDVLAGREILLICEGELNACSFWQVGHDAFDVVSFGPQDNIDHAGPLLAKLASRYKFVLIWADEPEMGVKALKVVGGRAKVAKSPYGRDANQLLQEGLLAEVLDTILTDAFGLAPRLQVSDQPYTTLTFPVDAYPVTIAGKWSRLNDGRIQASYTREELIWAMMAVGYEPSRDELALLDQS